MNEKQQKIVHWERSAILSLNALWNAVIGERGVGKTWQFKDWLIKDFLKNGKQGIYLRRYKTELRDIKTFFDDITWKYPTHTFDVKGGKFYIDGKVAGFYFALSVGVSKKSVAYPKVNKLGYDEFILEKGGMRYLPNEAEALLGVYKTVDREEDRVRVMLMANAVSQLNPIFLYFGINLKTNQRFYRYCSGEFAVELTDVEEFREHAKRTRFAKIISGTDYEKYSVENKFIQDDYSFIEKKPSDSYYIATFCYKGVTLGIWGSNKTGRMYASYQIDTTYPLKYSFTTEDHKPNFIILSQANKSDRVKMIRRAYDYGYLYYENLSIKNTMIDILKTLAIAKM